MADQIVSPVGKVLWSDLTQTDAYGKYTLKVGFGPDVDLSVIEEQIALAVDEKFGGKVTPKMRMPIVDGNTEVDDDGKVYETSKDMRIVRFKTKRKPQCVGPKGPEDIIDAEDIYSGCYVKVMCEFFPYDNVGKGVSAQLDAVQLYKHGPALTGGSGKKIPLKDAFAEVPESDDDDPWK